MKSLKSDLRTQIEERIGSFFDKMTFSLLGAIPKKGKKLYFFTEKPQDTLANLFVQSMRNRKPNEAEKDAAKSMLKTAHKYVESLREKTATSIVDRIDGKIKEAHLKGKEIGIGEVKEVISEEMGKAKSHFKMIAETEGTKARNSGALMDISKIGATMGIEDPYCFFILVRDGKTCKHCVKNHTHPDGTPKVFKLSEVKQSYLSKEERDNGDVSVCGQHPMCRCSLSYLQVGFGFKNGKVEWVGLHHDEYKAQKEKY